MEGWRCQSGKFENAQLPDLAIISIFDAQVLVGFAAVYLIKMALALPGSPLFNLLGGIALSLPFPIFSNLSNDLIPPFRCYNHAASHSPFSLSLARRLPHIFLKLIPSLIRPWVPRPFPSLIAAPQAPEKAGTAA